jgi:hypothetical protein
MHMQILASRDSRGERHRESSNAVERAIRAVAGRFNRRPDLCLVNVKFTDALERELAARAEARWPMGPSIF